MRTDAWYNARYWYWDIRSWLCHWSGYRSGFWRILTCRDCRRNRGDR